MAIIENKWAEMMKLLNGCGSKDDEMIAKSHPYRFAAIYI
jgi:hypothetical protein